MPLQIRRGTNAERQALIPSNGLVVGELLYVTDSRKVYIGTGVSGEHQGLAVTGYTNEDAIDAVGAALVAGSHTSISFTYGTTQDVAGRIDATVDLSNYSGTITADAFKGSLFSDDTTLLVNAVDGTFNGDLTGNVTGNLAGNVIGNVTGNLAGNVIGNLTGNVTGNVTGNLDGDVTGSIFADNSTMLIDSTNGTINGSVLTDVITPKVSVVRDSAAGFGFSLTGLLSDTDTAIGLEFQASRGSIDSPADLVLEDQMFVIAGKPWKTDQSNYVLSTIIIGAVDDVYGGGEASVAGKLIFGASNGVRAVDEPEFVMTYDGNGILSAPIVEARTAFQLPVYADDTARTAAIPAPAKGMIVFMTSGTSPAVTNVAVIYNGTVWTAL